MNVHFQNALNKVFNNKKVIDILILTKVVRNFEIANRKHKNKTFTDSVSNKKDINIGRDAVNTKLTAEVPVKADLSANTTVTLAEEAKSSEITVSKKADVEVKAVDAEKPVEDVVINVAKEAEGASLKTEVKAEIKAEANITVTLDKNAQDSTIIVTDENVKVEVEKTDEDGNVSKEEVTSTPAPEVTTTPGDSNVPNPNPNPNPDPEVPTITKISYTVSGSAATEVTLTKNAGTVSAEMKVGQTVTFTAPDGYNITAGSTLEFKEAKPQDASITLVKTSDPTVTVTIKVTFTNVTTATPDEGNVQKPNLSVTITVAPDSITGTSSTVATSAAIKTTSATGGAVIVTATATSNNNKTITVTVPDGTYTASFVLTATATVTGVNSPTFKYQWYKEGTSTALTETTSTSTYTIDLISAPTNKEGTYYVVVEYTDTNNKTWTCNSKDGTVTEKK